MKIARLFSGFDGAGEGIRDAGFELAWAIEKDAKIADIAMKNGHNVITADILDVDPSTLEQPDGIHASPVCTNASPANATAEVNEDGTKESKLDRDCAMKTVQFVEVLRPRLFTLENVWAYRNFQSFCGGDKCEGILPALKRLGYKVDYWHLNAADYGVPQTRKRLILVAALDFMPQKPWETHYDPAKPELSYPTLFGSARRPWVGWFEAIKDLVPTLPESEFAPWQLERLPTELRGSLLVGGGNTNLADAQTARRYDLAFEPAPTVLSNSTPGKVKAFIVHGTNANGLTVNLEDQPSATVMASAHSKSSLPRAFLVHPTDQRTMPVVDRDDPTFTIMAAHGNGNYPRAFIVDGQNARPDGVPCYRLADEPSMTITSSAQKVYSRAWLHQGKVVKMTPRALARFQSFGDSYGLSGNNTLDCKGIGNACPPRLFRELYGQMRERMYHG